MKFFVKTYGCQMNEADSEKIAALYREMGYQEAESIDSADLVIINTCSVREAAENRVGGLVNNLNKQHKQPKKPKIIVTGCMLRYTKAQLKKRLPGANQFIKFKDLLGKSAKHVSVALLNGAKGWITIMEGCDNFCTYCVVPYARGREVSRPIEEIYCEVLELMKRGYKEITLLGQNVNSYHKNENFQIRDKKLAIKVKEIEKRFKNKFAVLLVLLSGIDTLKKIKFLTSNPQDLTQDIIEAMKLKKIDRYLHLALQSGDDEILRKMNRRYTARGFLDLIRKIKKETPDIEFGTDIIVGFPGETESQFQNTVDLCKKVKFITAFIGKYSPRPGTAAYKLTDDIPAKIKKRRWRILEELINKPNLKSRKQLS